MGPSGCGVQKLLWGVITPFATLLNLRLENCAQQLALSIDIKKIANLERIQRVVIMTKGLENMPLKRV